MAKQEKVERVWIDIESTGLKASEEVMLELGIAIGDKWGNIYEGESWIIKDVTPFYRERVAAARQDEYVNNMHTASGLWDEIAALQNNLRYGTNWVQNEALDWLDDHGVEHGKFPTSGNNVGFDREFLDRWMPELNKHFHYRKIDVSSFKEACRDLNSRVFEHAPKKNEMHRAYPDILESAAEYKFYVENFLWTE